MRIIPEEFHLNKLTLRDLGLREQFVHNYSWAIPSLEAIQEIARFAGQEVITEVGAGKGYWASLINKARGIIQCFDVRDKPFLYFDDCLGVKTVLTDGSNFKTFHKVNFFDNQKKIEEAIENASILMICWPEWGEPWAFEYLTHINPQKVIFIGEWQGGCCADDQFFECLKSKYVQVKRIKIPQWSCIHDELWLFERKTHDSPSKH